MNHKKQYTMPQVTVVELEDRDLICTSDRMSLYDEDAPFAGARGRDSDYDD